jgi:hypothetical protein
VKTLGIDPGAMTGLALLDGGRPVSLQTRAWGEDGSEVKGWVREALEAWGAFMVVVEIPPKGYFMRNVSVRANCRISGNVGECRAKAAEIAAFCEGLGLTVMRTPPIRGGTKRKVSEAIWRARFKWEWRLPSNHARDAACLADHYGRMMELEGRAR